MFPILLRLLLCLGLLVDTVAPAFAATRMAMSAHDPVHVMPIAAGSAAGPSGHDAAADCHDRGQDTPAPTQPPAPGDEDCLQRCLDLCLQNTFAAVATTVALPASGPAPAPVRNLRTRAIARPAFPLLRPPIA
ncbi:CopL family metal-binding regulatory protein [Luteimonas viscosa]|uniref:CopL family metal-binding regulatory protein n=1 Tax=Luteimonas viscosa TaxID=1132694 RepID=A0A5D4XN12_9GAMM|nr:CopL family metal-binding regulatory protein [Luteimonas viscosa]TYT26067.1 CopL family metal-binding regulatory protein [Luteimonas viscosa]